ncbi:hypothetical protein SNE40_000959 [Patella caerulea]|uniref:Calponin-homology (CH) domain-containing protein n=1 Tax=Patella caerulea TaxID=87958 RepID=A0AAN8Q2Y5_PATCE
MTEVQVDVIGHQARSKEGRGISVRSGDSDKWIIIQKTTFTNWINVQLQPRGLEVKDLQDDFCDGVKLCALVECLQQKKIGRVVQKPHNQHQALQNVTVALTAIANDNVRLVNIGSEDIVNGNQKLILGLIWHLILRYQIGKTKFPPKKLMLAWLKAVIPDCNISNFTSDWNDGVALHALLEYCKPGLCPDWKKLSRNNRLDNCSRAMTLAKNEFNIPMIVRPEDFSSPHLDDLSGMTYLSYYMTVDSPGYHATLRNVRALLKHGTINNFTTDWHDGILLCNLTKSLGVEPGGWPNMTSNNVENLQRGMDSARKLGIEPILSAKEMSDPDVEHLGIMAYAAYFTRLTPRRVVADKATINGDFQNIHVGQESPSIVIVEESQTEVVESSNCGDDVDAIPVSTIPIIQQQDWNGSQPFTMSSASKTDVREVKDEELQYMSSHVQNDDHSETVVIEEDIIRPENSAINLQDYIIKEDVKRVETVSREKQAPILDFAQDGCLYQETKTFQVSVDSDVLPHDVRAEVIGPDSIPPVRMNWSGKTATCSFTPSETGMHKLNVYVEGEAVSGCPVSFQVSSDRSQVYCHQVEKCPIGQTTEMKVDTSRAGKGNVRIEARSPSGHLQSLTVTDRGGVHSGSFNPTEVGDWQMSVRYDDVDVGGSPYTVKVYDPNAVKVYGLEGGAVGKALAFNADTSQAGDGDLDVTVNYQGQNIPCYTTLESNGLHKINFTPQGAGAYKVNVRFAGEEVRGSPYTLEIVDSSMVTVTGDGLSLVPVNRPAVFNVQTRGAGGGNINVDVICEYNFNCVRNVFKIL